MDKVNNESIVINSIVGSWDATWLLEVTDVAELASSGNERWGAMREVTIFTYLVSRNYYPVNYFFRIVYFLFILYNKFPIQ